MYQAVVYQYIPPELLSHSSLILDPFISFFKKDLLYVNELGNFFKYSSSRIFLKLKFSHTIKTKIILTFSQAYRKVDNLY